MTDTPPTVLWKVERGPQRLQLLLRPHPKGHELVLVFNGEVRRTQVVTTESELRDVSTDWLRAAALEGWYEVIRRDDES